MNHGRHIVSLLLRNNDCIQKMIGRILSLVNIPLVMYDIVILQMYMGNEKELLTLFENDDYRKKSTILLSSRPFSVYTIRFLMSH